METECGAVDNGNGAGEIIRGAAGSADKEKFPMGEMASHERASLRHS
jgi:hypothetical protein